jgi:hypothetical protein
MITRSFLFLLAMLTGFSAAQAADNARPLPSAMGTAASAAPAQSLEVAVLEQLDEASVSWFVVRIGKISVPATKLGVVKSQIAANYCVFKCDRSRE